MGTLRYCGPAEFAAGIWAGIELDDAGGKNDGSIGGISYFQCPKNHGNFITRTSNLRTEMYRTLNKLILCIVFSFFWPKIITPFTGSGTYYSI